MKKLNEYLTESEKVHEFRFKCACDLSDGHLDKLELHLRKYEAYDISTPKRTIFQTKPLDFYDHEACEITIIDFKTKLPMSPQMVTAELTQKLGIAERDIRVINIHEPRELEIQKKADEADEESSAKLLDGEYSDHESAKAEDYHGEKHLTKFMKDLQAAKREMPTAVDEK